MSLDTKRLEFNAEHALGASRSIVTADESDPLGGLPRLSFSQVRLERRLADWRPDGRLPTPLLWLEKWTDAAITIDRPEILWRAAGLRRSGLTVQLTAARLSTRLGLGIEIPLAHALVDRLLKFDRESAESRLQVTPVEYGVWSFLILRVLDTLSPIPSDTRATGPLSVADLSLDRVGPDPFDSDGLGSIVTIRWTVRLGAVSAAVRLWVPESVVHGWLASGFYVPTARREPDGAARNRAADQPAQTDKLASLWRAMAGTVSLPQGLKRLRVGGVIPLSETPLTGTPASPSGPVNLILDMPGQGGRYRISTSTVENSGGRLLRLDGRPTQEPCPRDPIDATIREGQPMTQSNPSPSTPAPATSPMDVPVTLTVELGRVNLTLTQLADMKPGDVIELNRHSRAPVELTSNGRLVARGELVLIDTDLGVRVTGVFV